MPERLRFRSLVTRFSGPPEWGEPCFCLLARETSENRWTVRLLAKALMMEVLEDETELVRTASERHQTSIDEVARFLKRFAESSSTHADDRRDLRFPRHSICTRIRVTPCGGSFSPIGPTETGFTKNISAGGACIILPELPMSDVLRLEFAANLLPYTMLLRLFWKLPAGKLTECGGAFIGIL